MAHFHHGESETAVLFVPEWRADEKWRGRLIIRSLNIEVQSDDDQDLLQLGVHSLRSWYGWFESIEYVAQDRRQKWLLLGPREKRMWGKIRIVESRGTGRGWPVVYGFSGIGPLA